MHAQRREGAEKKAPPTRFKNLTSLDSAQASGLKIGPTDSTLTEQVLRFVDRYIPPARGREN